MAAVGCQELRTAELRELLCRTENTDGGTEHTGKTRRKGLYAERIEVASRWNTARLASMAERDPLTGLIIGAAIAVRNDLGCGLLESACDSFLCIELQTLNLAF